MSEPTEPTDTTPSPRRHRLRTWLIISGSVVGALLVLGVVLSAVLPHTAANTAASGTTGTTSPVGSATRATSTRAPAATTVRTSTRPPVTTAQRPTSAPPPDTLTGYGATLAGWDRTHTADPYFVSGSAYDPDPSLPQTDSRVTDKYVGVSALAGYFTDYTVNLASTSLAGAESVIASEFPPDTRILWTQPLNGCVQVEYGSAIVHAALGNTEVGDALVEYSDVVPGVAPAGNPTTFNDASVSNMPGAQPDPSASC